jgi:hypothetical protein
MTSRYKRKYSSWRKKVDRDCKGKKQNEKRRQQNREVKVQIGRVKYKLRNSEIVESKIETNKVERKMEKERDGENERERERERAKWDNSRRRTNLNGEKEKENERERERDR